MGRREETNRTVLAITCGKFLTESLKRGRDKSQSNEWDDWKQLQGKPKPKVLLREMTKHYKEMSATKIEYISIDKYSSKVINAEKCLPTT